MGRREAREATVRLLYGLEFHKEDVPYQLETYLAGDADILPALRKADVQFVIEITQGVVQHLDEIDEKIRQYSKDWAFHRIPCIDIAILRLAIYELFYRKDIPVNVSINEAVDLAKRYGHDESGTFINGILGNIYRDAQVAGTIVKEEH